jgi:cytochrome c biogenesis protein
LKILSKIFSIIGNVKLGIFYLILLAILSILGSTYIKQGEEYLTYVREYGEDTAKILWMLWLDKIFHAWYYQILIVLVGLAVIFATIDRFPRIFLSAYGKVIKIFPDKLKNRFDTLKYETDLPLKESYKRMVQFLHDKGFKDVEKVKEDKKEIQLFAEKGKISRIGMLVTHIGIIVFLVGAFMGSYFGIRGQVEIPEGEYREGFVKFREGSLQPGTEVEKLPFIIKVNKFWLDYYDSKEFKNSIKSFNSEIEIWDHGKLVKKTVIQVNSPTDYKGYRIFQASYGKTGDIKYAKIIVVDYQKMLDLMKKVADVNKALSTEKDPKKIEQLRKIMKGLETESVVLFSQAPRVEYYYGQREIVINNIKMPIINQTLNYKNPMLINQNVYDPVIVVQVEKDGKKFNLPILADPNVAIPAFNQFGYANGLKYLPMIEEFEPRYFSGLQISNFPGTNLIWLGTIIVVLGTMIAFYTIHRRVWVRLEDENGKTKIYISIYSQKFREAFEDDIKETLKDYIKA